MPGSIRCILKDTWSEHLWQMNVDGSDQHLIGDPDSLDWEPRVSPDGAEVVFTRWSDNNATEFSIWVRDLATGKEWQVKDEENKPEHPDWSPDGRWIIYNTWAQDGRIERLERVPANGPITEPTLIYGDEQHHAIKAAYSPDGSRIVFGCGWPAVRDERRRVERAGALRRAGRRGQPLRLGRAPRHGQLTRRDGVPVARPTERD